jgi:hypothetical protein
LAEILDKQENTLKEQQALISAQTELLEKTIVRAKALEEKVAEIPEAANRKRRREASDADESDDAAADSFNARKSKRAKGGGECELCGKIVKSLKDHRYQIHRAAVQACAANGCGYTTKRTGDLRRHWSRLHYV